MTIHARLAALPTFPGAISGGVMLAAVLGFTLAASTSAMAAECEVSMEQTWLSDLVASAQVSGPCASASIELVVRNGVDDVVWSASHAAANLFGFDGVADADSMGVALGDWLGDYADNSSSGRLPEWPEGADMPDAGEFPFYVEEGVSRDVYETLRTADYPMICYIQGHESTLCLVQQPGVSVLTNVGAQSFPG
ncbi:hypothetical protein OEG84_18115 [Hoeflea sp. G2-23]|uniref:Secreted protein n=1 Tax=Hoeflea algicola TaxID=2983763 RepID=A0ABT3ZE45_9HYPH|nr:hypothetical protein [Hoeflea algicola]MCY0149569.1 hypothetical protein [Hoeflea algicola]